MSRGAALALFVVLNPSFALAQTDADLAHIRAALDKPASKLTLQERTPDFRVHIVQPRNPLQDIFDVPPWMPEKPGWQPPPSWNLMSLVGALVHQVQEVKRAYDVRSAREEVFREIANYCAAQPGGGAGIAICPSAPAIR